MSRDSEKILIKSLLTFTHLSINAGVCKNCLGASHCGALTTLICYLAINVEQKNKLVADCFASLMFFIPTLNWHDSSQLPLLKVFFIYSSIFNAPPQVIFRSCWTRQFYSLWNSLNILHP